MSRRHLLFVWASSLLVLLLGWTILYRHQVFPNRDLPQVDSIPLPEQAAILRAAVPENVGLRKLLVFGDSLSDTGRLRQLSWGLYMPPQFYWKGRITNGPVWVDYAAQAMQVEAQSLAVGGAASNATGQWTDFFVPSLLKQVDTFVQKASPDQIQDTVAVLQIGGNNYLSGRVENVAETMADIERAASQLAALPFKAIALANMPNLAGLPRHPHKTRPLNDTQFHAISLDHNQALRLLLDQLRSTHPERHFFLFDIDTINRETIAERERFGLPILDRPCYRGDYLGEFYDQAQICQNVYEHRYWDWTHPNSKVHCFWALRFLQDLHEQDLLPTLHSEQAYELCTSIKSQR
jgi:thermolabile hemolysin